MDNHDTYKSDPKLTKKVEKELKKTLTNRSIGEGFASGAYLTTTYMSTLATTKAVENFQDDPKTMIGALAATTIFATSSMAGAYSSAHAARNLDAKKFTIGAIAVPLFAAWLNSALPDQQLVKPIFDNIDRSVLQINGIPTVDVTPE